MTNRIGLPNEALFIFELGIKGKKLSRSDKRIVKFTYDFINRYRPALEALAKK